MSSNITITFPDGNTRKVKKGISGLELAEQISKSFADGTHLLNTATLQEQGPVLYMLQEMQHDIDMVYNDEEMFSASECTKKELKEWVESLTSEHFQKIEKFFETMPKLQHTIKVVNPNTDKENTIVLEGLSDFFA